MIRFELPCVFTQNLDEIEEAKEKDLPVTVEIETFQTTKFNIPSDRMIVYNSTTNKRTTLRIYSVMEEFNWMVDLEYSLVDSVIEDALKKSSK